MLGLARANPIRGSNQQVAEPPRRLQPARSRCTSRCWKPPTGDALLFGIQKVRRMCVPWHWKGRYKATWKSGIQTPMAQGRSTTIIAMNQWTRTSRLSIKISLSLIWQAKQIRSWSTPSWPRPRPSNTVLRSCGMRCQSSGSPAAAGSGRARAGVRPALLGSARVSCPQPGFSVEGSGATTASVLHPSSVSVGSADYSYHARVLEGVDRFKAVLNTVHC